MGPKKFRITKKFWCEKNFGSKNSDRKKILGLEICLGLYKYFLSEILFCPKKIFGPKRSLAKKNFCPKKFLVWKKFLSKRNFGQEKKFGAWKKYRAWKSFGSKKKLCPKKMFWARKKFRPEKILDPKTMLGPKKFGAEKNFGSENFFVVVLVILVTWTRNHLNSAKSPWVVYPSNFSLLVHPLLIDFGEGLFLFFLFFLWQG